MKKCKIIILIKIKFLKTFVVHCLIHLKKIIIIFSHAKFAIFVYLLSNNFSQFKFFVFKLKKLYYLSMYVHLINVFIKIIISQNDNDKLIQISRNIRLNKIFELKYSNVFFLISKTKIFEKLTIR